MSKIKEIKIGKSVLVNIGNFENVRLEYAMTIGEIEENESFKDLLVETQDEVDKYLKNKVDELEIDSKEYMRKAKSKAGRFGI